MGRSRIALPCLALAVACAGCGRAKPQATHSRRVSVAPQVLQATPPSVQSSCEAIASSRRVPVLCPPRLPPGHWRTDHPLGLRLGRCTYLLSIETREPTHPFHIIFGGLCARLPLSTGNGRWPGLRGFRDELGLVGGKPLKPGQTHVQPVYPTVLRRVRVNRHPGLLLQIAPYPDGGVHGGHVAVVWNQRGHGYTLSMHFAERPSAATASQETEVLEAAGAMSAAPPAR